jgi:hypothetical protein
LNRGWRFCRPLPYHLATAPMSDWVSDARDFAGAASGLGRARAVCNAPHRPAARTANDMACQPKRSARPQQPTFAAPRQWPAEPKLAVCAKGSASAALPLRRDQPSHAYESEGWSGKRDSNPRLRPWQGRTLPLSYSRPRREPRPQYVPHGPESGKAGRPRGPPSPSARYSDVSYCGRPARWPQTAALQDSA